jgi:hypothetical protein
MTIRHATVMIPSPKNKHVTGLGFDFFCRASDKMFSENRYVNLVADSGKDELLKQVARSRLW